jgi:uncharacterized protein
MGYSPVGVRVRDMVPRFHSVQHRATTRNSSGLPNLGLVVLHSVAGSWTGRLDLPGAPLDVGVTLTSTPEALSGTLDVPAQGVVGLPLEGVTVDGATVRFAVPELPRDAAFSGTLAADASTISGSFTQAGMRFPLVLRRGTVAVQERPKEPRPPFPYSVEDVTYRGPACDLAGTLTRPAGPGPFPAVLLVPGSGAHDRDETVAGHKLFLLLADTLTRAGTAVLRVDDRGVGGSAGTTAAPTYDDLVADIGAGLAFLRGRPEVDPARVGLLGHSEGGYLAPLAALRLPGAVAFAVLLAGPAVSGEDVLVEQNRLILTASGQSEEQVDAQVTFVHELCRLLRARADDEARALVRDRVRVQIAALPPEQRPAAEEVQAPVDEALRSFVTYDPAPALAALRVPVLALYGGKDLQVPAAQSEPVLRERLAGNPDATVRTIDGLNHLMQPAGTGLPQEYAAIPTTLDPQVLELVATWMRERYSNRAGSPAP